MSVVVGKLPRKAQALLALILFSLSAFLQLLPLSLHPVRGLNDNQDCLLNTWILARGSENLLRSPADFFNGRIFHPHTNTLSFSEHLLPLTLIALPIQKLSGNPVLAYNFVFFLFCILNAYAMFLLVRHLTRDFSAAVAAGLIFAFSATLMQQLTHLQLLAAWPIPLALLFLHRYFEDKQLSSSLLFSFFFVFQALACVYYGLFMISVLPVVLAAMIILHREHIGLRFLVRLFWPLALAAAVLFVFSLPYFSLFRHFAFKRELTGGAGLLNYLAVSADNLLLGRILHALGSHEFFLFPGLAATLLAASFLFSRRHFFSAIAKPFQVLLLFVTGIYALSLATVLITGGKEIKLGFIVFSDNNIAKRAFALFFVGFLWFLLAFIKFSRRPPTGRNSTDASLFLYALLSLWTMFLSFGSAFSLLGVNSPYDAQKAHLLSPYRWFYEIVPGFKGIRVPSRYAVLVLCGAAVLAGFGLKELFRKFKIKNALLAPVLLVVLLLNLEYLTIPQRLETLPVGDEIPPVYTWLKEKEGDFAVMELPLPKHIADESASMYFSLFHGKPIVNGYSGFIPLSAEYIRSVFEDFPNWSSIDILQELGVRYVVFHTKMWNSKRVEAARKKILTRYRDFLKSVRTFSYSFPKPNSLSSNLGEDEVYEVTPLDGDREPEPQDFEMSTDHWIVRSSVNEDLLPLLKDGRLDTAWKCGHPKRRGDFLVLEFDSPVRVSRVSLMLGDFSSDFGVSFFVDTSEDGMGWKLAYPGYSPGAFARNLVLSPRQPVQEIAFSGDNIRFVKITHVGRHPSWQWSVAEIKVFAVPDGFRERP